MNILRHLLRTMCFILLVLIARIQVSAQMLSNDRVDRGYVPVLPFRTFDTNNVAFKKEVIRVFNSKLAGLKYSDITNIGNAKKIRINGIGLTTIYKIKFSNSSPEVLGKTAYLLLDTHARAAIFFIDSIFFFKENAFSKEFVISGVYKIKSKGYYTVYLFDQNAFVSTIDSGNLSNCSNPIAVYNNSLNCISYKPFMLNLTREDVNGDGYTDLIFSGKLLFFCNGLEFGIGRGDREAVDSKNFNIIFTSYQEKGKLHWRLSNTSVCNILQEKD